MLQAPSPPDPAMGGLPGLPLASALFFGCLGEINKAATSSIAHSALHPLRRRPKSCSRKDPPRFTTLLPTSSAPGALLLSSYLLVHFIIPRMRTLNMEPPSENAVCLLCTSYCIPYLRHCAGCARVERLSLTVDQNFRSGLRPPQVHAPAAAPITTTTTCLQEITDSQHNARVPMTGIPAKRTYNGSTSHRYQSPSTLLTEDT